MTDDWTPEYDVWRHGGWYVTNVRYPETKATSTHHETYGGCGCVSRNYPDKKWRIVCDPRFDSDTRTYPTRDAAARAERALTIELAEEKAKVTDDKSHNQAEYDAYCSRPIFGAVDKSVLDSLPPFASGSHEDSDAEVCAMEALARACGLGTTDHPECASDVIGSFVRSLNDALPDSETPGEWGPRDRIIRPLLPLMVGTANDGHDEARMWLLADRAVRVFAANAMEAAGLPDQAKILRALGAIRDQDSADSAARSAYSAADSAARSAAGSAAGSAAYSAARSAYSAAYSAARSAYSAADSAARSAYSAAYSAADSAADSAAYSAAYSAARSAASNEQAIIDTLRDICMIGREV